MGEAAAGEPSVRAAEPATSPWFRCVTVGAGAAVSVAPPDSRLTKSKSYSRDSPGCLMARGTLGSTGFGGRLSAIGSRP